MTTETTAICGPTRGRAISQNRAQARRMDALVGKLWDLAGQHIKRGDTARAVTLLTRAGQLNRAAHTLDRGGTQTGAT